MIAYDVGPFSLHLMFFFWLQYIIWDPTFLLRSMRYQQFREKHFFYKYKFSFFCIESPFSFIWPLVKKKIKPKNMETSETSTPPHPPACADSPRSAIVHDLGACKSRWVAWQMCTLRLGEGGINLRKDEDG